MRSFFFALCLGSLGVVGCTSTETVDCLDEPSNANCMETCAANDAPDWCVCLREPTGADCRAICAREGDDNNICRGFDMDGGTDAMDAPDVMDSPPCDAGCSEDRCINGQCVECLQASECTNATAARCDNDGDNPTYRCVACIASDECDGNEAGNYCVPAGRPMEGTCVECLNSEGQCADNDVCRVPGGDMRQPNWMGNYSCVEGARALNVCETCVNDDQCGVGFVCAPLTFDPSGDNVPEGYVCVPTSRMNPFSQATPVTTRNNTDMMVRRLAVSSCQAYLHWRQPGRGTDGGCDDRGTPNHMNCGLMGTTGDAVCRRQPPGEPEDPFLCTMPCDNSDSDCERLIGNGRMCGAGYCGL